MMGSSKDDPMGHPGVEDLISRQSKWGAELTLLRAVVRSCGLDEEVKWGQPCYSMNGVNLIILGAYRDACVISFLKGSQLRDEEGWLEKPGPNTIHGRVIRFTSADMISARADRLRSYVMETIDCLRSGREVGHNEEDVRILWPHELIARFQADTAYEQAFLALTPGRQRAYLIHFTATPTPSTRFARIDRFRQRIMDGIGMQDCHCGLSQRMPRCDGSHRKST